MPAYHSPPLRMMGAILANVSTLLMRVGCPNSPSIAGYGGRGRGVPRLPSTDAINAVSSPQTNAPAPRPQIHAEAEARAADIGTQQTHPLRLPNGIAQALDGQRILRPHIDVAFRRADGVSRDQHAFEHAVRIALQHAAIHERARIAFVGIADDVLLRADRLRYRAPLQARGISRAAAAAQAALGHLVDDFARSHLGQRLDQRGVAVGRHVVFDALGIDDARVLQHDLFLPLEERNIGRADQPRHRGPPRLSRIAAPSAASTFLYRTPSPAGRDQRAFRAQPHAAHALDLAVAFGAAARDFLVERVFHRLALAGEASGGDAHIHALR